MALAEAVVDSRRFISNVNYCACDLLECNAVYTLRSYAAKSPNCRKAWTLQLLLAHVS